MSILDFSDVPTRGRHKKIIWLVVFALLSIFIVHYVLKSTFAGQITIGSGNPIEYGQGVSATAECAGATSLTITPGTTFNGSSYYLNNITVANIPSTCSGDDFMIDAFNSTDNAPLRILNSTGRGSMVYDNAGTFTSSYGSTITSGSGTFTLSLGTPLVSSSAVYKIGIQSSPHSTWPCNMGGTCHVGDVGPGGGVVFYAPGTPFSEPGSYCNASCSYLEVAPSTWYPTDGPVHWTSDTNDTAMTGDNSTDNGAGNQAIGQGYANTYNYMLVSNSGNSYTGDTSGAAYLASQYSASDSSKGEWFIPSLRELDMLYTNRSVWTWQPPTAWEVSTSKTMSYYWSSSETGAQFAFPVDMNGSGRISAAKSLAYVYARPIRAF